MYIHLGIGLLLVIMGRAFMYQHLHAVGVQRLSWHLIFTARHWPEPRAAGALAGFVVALAGGLLILAALPSPISG